jgi:hypothetical protein
MNEDEILEFNFKKATQQKCPRCGESKIKYFMKPGWQYRNDIQMKEHPVFSCGYCKLHPNSCQTPKKQPHRKESTRCTATNGGFEIVNGVPKWTRASSCQSGLPATHPTYLPPTSASLTVAEIEKKLQEVEKEIFEERKNRK